MILITGGAGYIGSHINKLLWNNNRKTIVYDNLSTGFRSFVKWGEFCEGDLSDISQLRKVFQKYDISVVVHMAASAYVGESLENPEKYYYNNVVNSLNLFKVMREFNVNKIIFSSSCATYGDPTQIPITEDHAQKPINPYGRTKLIIENIINDYADAYGFKYVILRYFNAAGAGVDCDIGEYHNPETHIIPLLLDVALGKVSAIKIFGIDYCTSDGTCIRDFIHVDDLANAHVLALDYMESGEESTSFNLGTGYGISVKELVALTSEVTGKKITVIEDYRRKGDPAILIACALKANNMLNWKPRYCSAKEIIESAWKWHEKIFITINLQNKNGE